jgi:hypothetical protein
MNNLINDSNWVDKIVTINQYRNNMLVYSGDIRIWDNSSVNSNSPTSLSGGPTKGHGRKDDGTGVSFLNILCSGFYGGGYYNNAAITYAWANNYITSNS